MKEYSEYFLRQVIFKNKTASNPDRKEAAYAKKLLDKLIKKKAREKSTVRASKPRTTKV
jgi:hypothetical protein